MENSVFEFRGVEGLVYAPILTDDNGESGYTTGEVKQLAPVAKITKGVETSSESHYYDNQPMIVINSEGADTIGIICAPPDLETYCDITGKDFDPDTGMMIDSDATPKYFALGYVTEGTDGKKRYVWRLKGQFAIPSEEYNTKDNGIQTTNTELTFTGINTNHKFAKKNKTAKGIIVDERYAKVDFSKFFDSVQTPDTVKAKTA